MTPSARDSRLAHCGLTPWLPGRPRWWRRGASRETTGLTVSGSLHSTVHAWAEETLMAKGRRRRKEGRGSIWPLGPDGQAFPLSLLGTSSSQKPTPIKKGHTAFTKHATLGTSAQTTPCANTLSPSLTSLENASAFFALGLLLQTFRRESLLPQCIAPA